MDIVIIRDLINILILVINNPTILIKIYLMMILINYITNILTKIIYN